METHNAWRTWIHFKVRHSMTPCYITSSEMWTISNWIFKCYFIFSYKHISPPFFSLLKERKCFEGEIRQLAWKCCEVLCCSRGNSHTCWSYREKSVSSCVLQWMHRLIKLQWCGAAWAGVPHDYVNTAADPLKEVPLQSSQCHTGNSKEKQETFITADVLQ